MHSGIDIDKEINSHLGLLDNMQKKEVLAVIKSFITETGESEKNGGRDYEEEMKERFEEYENGAIKGFTIEEATTRAKAAFQLRKNK